VWISLTLSERISTWPMTTSAMPSTGTLSWRWWLPQGPSWRCRFLSWADISSRTNQNSDSSTATQSQSRVYKQKQTWRPPSDLHIFRKVAWKSLGFEILWQYAQSHHKRG
jgi:hypothetical protein